MDNFLFSVIVFTVIFWVSMMGTAAWFKYGFKGKWAFWHVVVEHFKLTVILLSVSIVLALIISLLCVNS